jgi:hypothetical protein
MGLRLWLSLAAVGTLVHLFLFVADREIEAGVDRLSELKFTHPDGLDDDLKLVSARSPYMRDER